MLYNLFLSYKNHLLWAEDFGVISLTGVFINLN